jgi:pimeloyl-[acyl-carrier protein] methyl ester esterase
MADDTFGTFLDGCRNHTSVTLKRFRTLCRDGALQPRTLLRQLGVGVPETDPLYLATGLEVLAQLDTREALQAYGGPQLHLFAGSDALVPPEAAKALSELLPDVEVGLVEESSHAFLLEYPQELAAGIKSFLHESGDD